MKLTILGSGTVVPNGARNSAGYFVELSDYQIMLDCGAGTLHALDRFGLPWEQLPALFISHFHVDHVGELAALFFAFKHGMRNKRGEPFTLFGPGNLDRIITGLREAFGEDLFEPKFPVTVRMIAPGECVQLTTKSRLLVAKTPHTAESLAVRVENNGRSLCYTGDTGYTDDLAGFFKRADLLISECSLREPKEGVSHLSIKGVAAIARRAEVARLVVTHFYFDFDEDELKRELEKDYSGEVMIGRDGMVISI